MASRAPGEPRERAPLKEAVEQLENLVEQDLEPDPDRGGSRIRRGTAKDRQISVTDPDMRHGRKSRSQIIKGYKRFVARELDHGLIVGVAVQPANRPEHEATADIRQQVASHGEVVELHIDRGFLASDWARELHDTDRAVRCRPWPSRNRGLFTKEEFEIDLVTSVVTCPAGQQATIQKTTARFSAKDCANCRLRQRCTRAGQGRGRTISIHPQEELMVELRSAKRTTEGREKLRERVAVEHSLAHVCARQGRHARYRGTEKNVFDLCRYAVVENLFAADRMERAA